MAKHVSIAKQIKALVRASNNQQTETEQNRLRGLANPNGRLTYAHRMMKKAFTDEAGLTGTRKCSGGCGKNIAANKSRCLACSSEVPDYLRMQEIQDTRIAPVQEVPDAQ